jgi:hypothetical protein
LIDFTIPPPYSHLRKGITHARYLFNNISSLDDNTAFDFIILDLKGIDISEDNKFNEFISTLVPSERELHIKSRLILNTLLNEKIYNGHHYKKVYSSDLSVMFARV